MSDSRKESELEPGLGLGDGVEVEVLREPGTEDIPLPRYMTDCASGMDLCAAIEGELRLEPGDRALVSTGIRLAIPAGFEGQVRPRSGLASKYGITLLNSPGTIDADYRGVVQCILINLGSEPFTIRRGDRIAQLVFARVERARLVERSRLSGTRRGDGGFGHTGR